MVKHDQTIQIYQIQYNNITIQYIKTQFIMKFTEKLIPI